MAIRPQHEDSQPAAASAPSAEVAPTQIGSNRSRTNSRDIAVRDAEPPGEFFIPFLCTIPALSLLILMAALIAVVLTMIADALTWERFAVVSLFVQWVVLTSSGALCVARPVLARVPLAVATAIAFAIVAAITGAFSALAQWLTMSDGSVDLSRMGANVVIALVISAFVLRYFFVQQQLREQRDSELKSRIQALQSRIRPHFLFNSMNIIASLIATDPDTAESVVEDLSELFRASLNDAGNQVPLHEELALCERYLRIEALRLGDRLRVIWNVGEVPNRVRIPLLTLQPLLENSIYHGIQPRPEGGTIEVTVRYEQQQMLIRVSNPVDRGAERKSEGNQMALINIRARLHALYGPRADLHGAVNGNQYIAEMRYPVAGELT